MLKGVFVVLFSLAAIASAIDLSRYKDSSSITESEFKELFRSYLHMAPFFVQDSDERFEHFKSKIISIIDHNQNPSRTWKREVNQYTGVLPEELNGFLLMEPQDCFVEPSFHVSFRDGLFDYPTAFDWRDSGIISPVKNQGNYACCWAFAAAAAIEAHWALYLNSTPTLLSEQQLIDCAIPEDSEGGFPSIAFEYVKNAGGIETENTYPYTMQQESCIFNVSVSGADVAGSVNITVGDELAILHALVQHGPVTALMEANDDFTSYTGGVYVGQSCGQNVNHAVLIVGYGTDSETGMDYWIGKNSWGRAWGEGGYFRIQRGVNMCGIANCASFPDMIFDDRISI